MRALSFLLAASVALLVACGGPVDVATPPGPTNTGTQAATGVVSDTRNMLVGGPGMYDAPRAWTLDLSGQSNMPTNAIRAKIKVDGCEYGSPDPYSIAVTTGASSSDTMTVAVSCESHTWTSKTFWVAVDSSEKVTIAVKGESCAEWNSSKTTCTAPIYASGPIQWTVVGWDDGTQVVE
jgi:hypothetical protein